MDPLDRLPSPLRTRLARVVPVRRVRSALTAPLASFSFDDFPRSAWTAGAPLLARYGARGTFYVSGRFCGAHEDGLDYYTVHDLRAAHAAGHEIACHSFEHRRGSEVRSAELEADFARNAEFLRRCLGDAVTPETYAYPYGHVTPRTKRLAGRRFPACRGITPGINAGVLELAQLKAVPLERRHWNARQVEQLVRAAVEQSGWIIFFSHDVSDSPSPYGATPYMLKHALEAVRAAGIAILPVREALKRATAPALPPIPANAATQAFSASA
jgi:peptidoglycan/xylan/chitin deacetylase (PgdA/CDA1 family)